MVNHYYYYSKTLFYNYISHFYFVYEYYDKNNSNYKKK